MKLAIHGNCQTWPFHDILKSVLPMWDIESFQVHLVKNEPDDLARYERAFTEADIIICQPVGDGYRGMECLSDSWIRSAAKPATPVVSVPSLYYPGYFAGFAVLQDAEGLVASYESHESVLPLVAGILSGDDDDAILARLMDEGLFDSGAVMKEHDRSIQALRRREIEGKLDVTVSFYLEEHFASCQLFHTHNHPARPVIAYVIRQVLAALSLDIGVPDKGPDVLGYYHIPALPTVATTFQEQPENACLYANGKALERPVHYRQCIADMRTHAVPRLERLFAQHEHTLRRFLPSGVA